MASQPDKFDWNNGSGNLSRWMLIMKWAALHWIGELQQEIKKVHDKKVPESLLFTTSETKTVVMEVLDVLNLFDKHLQTPSEETAKPLQLLFDRGKTNQNFTPELKLETIALKINFSTQKELEEKRKQLETLQIIYEETLFYFGQISVEKDKKQNEQKKSEVFQQIYRPSIKAKQSVACSSTDRSTDDMLGFPKPQTTNETGGSLPPNASVGPVLTQQFSRGAEAMMPGDKHQQGKEEDIEISDDNELSFSVQQEDSNGRENISLGNVPTTSGATIVCNKYKLLLLSLADGLLLDDIVKIKDWAAHNYSIENAHDAHDVLVQLDEKGLINASNLTPLKNFFESSVRYDKVHIIDNFLLGNYSLLQVRKKKPKLTAIRLANVANDAVFTTGERTTTKPMKNNRQNTAGGSGSNRHAEGDSSFSVPQNDSNDRENTNEKRTTPENPLLTNNAGNFGGSNGLKLSKFLRPDTEHNDVPRPQSPASAHTIDLRRGENWLCSHYKRHCSVKFKCCDMFWPCSRCHNNKSTCGQRKLKSRDTEMVKCVYCSKEQQFGQFCCNYIVVHNLPNIAAAFANVSLTHMIILITAKNAESAEFMEIVHFIVMFVAFVWLFNFVEITNAVKAPHTMNVAFVWRMLSPVVRYSHALTNTQRMYDSNDTQWNHKVSNLSRELCLQPYATTKTSRITVIMSS